MALQRSSPDSPRAPLRPISTSPGAEAAEGRQCVVRGHVCPGGQTAVTSALGNRPPGSRSVLPAAATRRPALPVSLCSLRSSQSSSHLKYDHASSLLPKTLFLSPTWGPPAPSLRARSQRTRPSELSNSTHPTRALSPGTRSRNLGRPLWPPPELRTSNWGLEGHLAPWAQEAEKAGL